MQYQQRLHLCAIMEIQKKIVQIRETKEECFYCFENKFKASPVKNKVFLILLKCQKMKTKTERTKQNCIFKAPQAAYT